MRVRVPFLFVMVSVAALRAAGAQPLPDTTAAWRYYPLGVGDAWHYQVEENYYAFCMPCRYQLTREVEGLDTLDGRQYAVVRWRSHNVPGMPNPPSATWVEHIRFDTLNVTPVGRGGTQSEYFVDVDGCRLDEPFPSSPDSTRATTCPGDWPATVQGGYEQPLPFGGLGPVKSITRETFTLGFTTTVAADFGVVARFNSHEIDIDRRYTLVYARIAGVEFGTPVVATEPALPPGGPSLTASPNPAGGHATIAFHASLAGSARVTLHDLVGREVLVAHDGWLPAGDHRVAVDLGDLPAGIYLVRAIGPRGALGATIAVR